MATFVPRLNIGAAPPETTASDKFKVDMKIRVLHGDTLMKLVTAPGSDGSIEFESYLCDALLPIYGSEGRCLQQGWRKAA